jgi:hypothetical protein
MFTPDIFKQNSIHDGCNCCIIVMSLNMQSLSPYNRRIRHCRPFGFSAIDHSISGHCTYRWPARPCKRISAFADGCNSRYEYTFVDSTEILQEKPETCVCVWCVCVVCVCVCVCGVCLRVCVCVGVSVCVFV